MASPEEGSQMDNTHCFVMAARMGLCEETGLLSYAAEEPSLGTAQVCRPRGQGSRRCRREVYH